MDFYFICLLFRSEWVWGEKLRGEEEEVETMQVTKFVYYFFLKAKTYRKPRNKFQFFFQVRGGWFFVTCTWV